MSHEKKFDHARVLRPLTINRAAFPGENAALFLSAMRMIMAFRLPSQLPELTQELAAVRQYGEEHGLLDLTEPKWEGEEQDGWAMAAVALKLLGGQAVYCGPSENGLTFLLLRRLRWAVS